jgi:hypothetical protein
VLAADVINCIRETQNVELPPRDRDVAAAVQAAVRRLRARGGGGSVLHERLRIGIGELDVRAEIIWRVIQRCHTTAGTPADERLADGLQQQVAEHLTAQSAVVRDLVDATTLQDWPEQVRNLIPGGMLTRRNELIGKFGNEVRFYVRDAEQAARAQPAATGQGHVTIVGNVGAVQTGPYATAQIHVDAAGSARMIEALERLHAALPQTADMTGEQREQSADVIGDLVAASRAPRLNGPKIAGLLNGLAVTVQTVASLRPAWDIVRNAARAMGIPVP